MIDERQRYNSRKALINWLFESLRNFTGEETDRQKLYSIGSQAILKGLFRCHIIDLWEKSGCDLSSVKIGDPY